MTFDNSYLFHIFGNIVPPNQNLDTKWMVDDLAPYKVNAADQALKWMGMWVPLVKDLNF
jgi:hypothetical protein